MRTRYLSPLRYPGGKAALGYYLGELISGQWPKPRVYVEPFAGGAGAALRLLYDEYVERIVINDLDAGIAAFWRCVFWRSEELTDLIQGVQVSMKTWEESREIYLKGSEDELELGFATFFLNRTNRSGILRARPIGGMKQDGRYGIAARFHKADLIARIQLLSRYRNRVKVVELEALELIERVAELGEWGFIYADPPYLRNGAGLYLDSFPWERHELLAQKLQCMAWPWVVTYDVDERVHGSLYPGLRCARFKIAHTAAKQHVGMEHMVFAESVRHAKLPSVGSGGAEWVQADKADG